MGSKELIEGAMDYPRRLADRCIYCGEPHHHDTGMGAECKHCWGKC